MCTGSTERQASHPAPVVFEGFCYHDGDVDNVKKMWSFFAHSSLILNPIPVAGGGVCSSHTAASVCERGAPDRERRGVTDSEHVHGAGGCHAGRSRPGELQT